MTEGRFDYRPELDGFRAIGVIAVMIFHSMVWFPTVRVGPGALGVDLFFVLSGFLITSLLVSEHERTGTIDRPRFYIRRALRLLPALALGILLGAVVVAVIGANLNGMSYPKAALAALFFVGNWFQFDLGVLGHTWSLGLEEQYYFVWPFVLVTVLRRGYDRFRVSVFAAAIAVLVAALRATIFHLDEVLPETTFNLLHAMDRADGVLLGSALALVVASPFGPWVLSSLRSKWIVPASLVVLTGVVWGSVRWDTFRMDTVFVANVCFALLIGHAFADADATAARVLRSGPLPLIGRMSYGIYVFHWPLFSLTQHTMLPNRFGAAATGWLATFAVAAVSYLVIELPALSLKARFQARGDRNRGALLGARTYGSLGR